MLIARYDDFDHDNNMILKIMIKGWLTWCVQQCLSDFDHHDKDMIRCSRS